jgi:hypothetical protein
MCWSNEVALCDVACGAEGDLSICEPADQTNATKGGLKQDAGLVAAFSRIAPPDIVSHKETAIAKIQRPVVNPT